MVNCFGRHNLIIQLHFRYLVKAWHQASTSSNVAGTLKYLQEFKTSHMYLPWDESLSCIVRAFQLVAAR